MNHIFIVNPVAGNGKAIKLIPAIEAFFEKNSEEYHIEVTKYIGHATEIVKNYSSKEKCRFYAVGGDGTVNEVVNGLAESDNSLAVIPTGSGNDFIKSVYSSKNLLKLLYSTIKGSEKRIDIARYNEKYFINISSVGFDAEVTYNAVCLKKLRFFPSRLVYYVAAIKTFMKFKKCHVKMHIDGKEVRMSILMIVVANGKYYGGGVKSAPEAEIDDGMLDICIIGEKTKLDIIKLIPQYVRGAHKNIDKVYMLKGKKLIINGEDEFSVNYDGEVQSVKKAVFEIIHKGLSLVIPANKEC